ncbi:hypothetical protein BDQ12DRAFT_676648 [Crucibulum laeve]|uniref:Sas10/Utp3/C1D family-domain-containing protein n=1 Tax=Crucibulum laeve TaxID=68775 RepID=A0A5C3ME60_9AGAR|nr:hypothetical protein BDQ12DRAFT_676648 [Crucibulum laeve]
MASLAPDDFRAGIDAMTGSVASVREALNILRQNDQSQHMKEGISLLSLKHHLLLSYLRALALISSRRALGHTLQRRSLPTQSFSEPERDARGNNAGDLVDSMVESRIVLEKVETLETRMRYQIDKLVRLAEEPEAKQSVMDDPLAFRPNPQNFANDMDEDSDDEQAKPSHHENASGHAVSDPDAIYRPPRLAPVPYLEKSKNQARRNRAPVPFALANLSSDLSRPHVETTSGLGGIPALASNRAAYLKRLKDFEEENFTRMIMKKSDAKRRARDEEDLALGGDLAGHIGSRRRAGGLEDEFGDVLRSVDRVSGGRSQGDGYEELRKKGRKEDVLERSRRTDGVRNREDAFGEDVENVGRMKKRSRFELETKNAKKKISKRKA